jgi:hypothetical protein
VQIPTPAPPRFLIVEAPQGSTMPSHDLPVLEAPVRGLARAIPAWVVVALVVAALAAGFVLGFAVARAT